MNFKKIILVFILISSINIVFSSTTTSGINLTYEINVSSTNYNYSTIYDLVKDYAKNPLVTYYDYSTKEIKYTLFSFNVEGINYTTYPLNYDATYKIYAITNDLSPKCSITLPYEDCTFTALGNDFLENYLMYKFNVCNELGGCYNLAKKFTLIQKDYANIIVSGINLSFQSIITEVSTISYITPTPNHNTKSTSNSFTIKISDGTHNLTSANVSINGINYSMSDTGSFIWNYTHSNLTITKPEQYTFKVYTNEGNLNERKITLYPSKDSNRNFPAISLFSLFIALLTIIFLN